MGFSMQIFWVTGLGLELHLKGGWVTVPGCTGRSLFEFYARLQEIQGILSTAKDSLAVYRDARFLHCLNRAIAANRLDPATLSLEQKVALLLPTEQQPLPPLVALNQFPPDPCPRPASPYNSEEDLLDHPAKFAAMVAAAHGESMDLAGAWALMDSESAVDLMAMVRAIGRARMLPEDKEKDYMRRQSDKLRRKQAERLQAFNNRKD